jgi:catechol 2,3-dioxygenase-like lactoylglutathione lyase family enzyme
MSSAVTGILQVAITVKDIDRAIAFYRDVLELRLLMNAPNMAFFDCGGVRLYLASGAGSEHSTGSGSIYFRTSDMTGLLATLRAKEAVIHQEPQVIARMPDHDLWLMWVKDPDGNLLGVMEERARG